MHKTLIALLFTATLPALAMAMPADGQRMNGAQYQGGHHQEGQRQGGYQHGKHAGGAMFKDLDLTREQRQQVGKLMGEQMHERRAITQRYLDKLPAAEQKAMQDEREAAKSKTHSEIRALLTPEQQKAFDEHQKAMQERRAERAEFEAWKAQKADKAKAE